MEMAQRGGNRRMKALLIFMLVFASGCAGYRALIATNGAESADAALGSAELAMRKASTNGALERRYSLVPVPESRKSRSWAQLCYGVEKQPTVNF